MTLPAELRAEAEREMRLSDTITVKHDPRVRALLHRAADALEWRGIADAPIEEDVLIYEANGRHSVAMLSGGRWLVWDHYPRNPTHWRPLDAPLPATPEG